MVGGYEFPVDVQALLAERSPQFVNLGLPKADLEKTRTRITSLWVDAPGGWTYELSALAARCARHGDHSLAALAYGIAKFPVLANEGRRQASRRQIEEYQLAAPGFGIRFERRTLSVPYRGTATAVPVHLLSPVTEARDLPVLLFGGGIDTWKMDLHPLAVGLAVGADVTVLAVDIPGTGELDVLLDAHADEVICGLITKARRIGNGKVAHFGLSFGGNFSAMSGLTGEVDAAVNLGGPVDVAFTPANFPS